MVRQAEVPFLSYSLGCIRLGGRIVDSQGCLLICFCLFVCLFVALNVILKIEENSDNDNSIFCIWIGSRVRLELNLRRRWGLELWNLLSR